MDTYTLKVIARIHSDFPTKFGIPRQSGLIPELTAAVVFEPAYRNPEALRGLEEFSHIWLIWQFSEAVREEWSPHGPASPPGREQAGGGFLPAAHLSGRTPSVCLLCSCSAWKSGQGMERC